MAAAAVLPPPGGQPPVVAINIQPAQQNPAQNPNPIQQVQAAVNAYINPGPNDPPRDPVAVQLLQLQSTIIQQQQNLITTIQQNMQTVLNQQVAPLAARVTTLEKRNEEMIATAFAAGFFIGGVAVQGYHSFCKA